jgi:hypothetical protein
MGWLGADNLWPPPEIFFFCDLSLAGVATWAAARQRGCFLFFFWFPGFLLFFFLQFSSSFSFFCPFLF